MISTVIDGRYAVAGDFRVGEGNPGQQEDVELVSLGADGWMAIWSSQPDYFSAATLHMQRFDLGGHRVSGDIVIGSGVTPSVARTADGGIVVAWTSLSPYPVFEEVKARRFDSHGNPVGGEILVNTVTSGSQGNPHVAGLAGGGFAVIWETLYDSKPLQGQLFSAAGEKLGSQFTADDSTVFATSQFSNVTALPNGGFLVSWYSFFAADDSAGGSMGQIFDASGAKTGSSFHLNPPLPGSQFTPAVAVLPDGRLVTAWGDEGSGSEARRGIWVQLLDGAGNRIGDPVKASTLAAFGAMFPVLAVTATGFTVAWGDLNTTPDHPNQHVRGQAFDFALNKIGSEFAISAAKDDQINPAIAVLDNGAIVVAYHQGLGSGSDIRANMLFPATYGTDQGEVHSGTDGRDFHQALGGDDTVSGAGDDDWLDGGAGDDRLDGGAGDDLLSGGEGVDTYIGGAGIDTVDFRETGTAAVTVNLALGMNVDPAPNPGGLRAVHSGEALDAYGNYESLAGIENIVTGAGNDRVYGGLEANRIETGAGNDLLSGGGGADLLVGGAGDDIYLMLPLNDPAFLGTIVELAGEGTDQISTYLSETALPGSAAVENLVGLATSGQILLGNGLNNVITGASGDDILVGGDGTDLLNGGEGNDTADYSRESGLQGTLVNLRNVGLLWVISPNAARDSFGGYDSLTSIENVKTGGGRDTVYGDGGANRIETGAGDDLLIGGGGADILIGGSGDDVYLVRASDGPAFEGVIVEAAGEGMDEIRTDLAAFSLVGFTNVERLTGFNSDGQSLTGNGLDNLVIGSLGADTLAGGDGNDILGGDSGADTMRGGAGDDIYLIDAFDSIEELPGEGTDTVEIWYGTSAAHFVLPANVENLLDVSNLGQTVAGNALDNVLTMGGGNDVLDLSAGGNDTASGGGGNDYFYFGAAFTADDVIVGGSGTDTVGLLGNYNLTLGANTLSGVETFSLLSGTAAGGTEHVSYAITTVDANVPAGGRLTVYAGGLLADESLFFNGYAETDGALSVYGGAGNDTFAGGPANDAFVGGAGDDTMYGLGGMDWLEGGLGADTMRGGPGNDVFVYQSAAESTAAKTDHIVDFEYVSDHIVLTNVDANSNAAGDQAFNFIGGNAFSHTAGELRAYQSGASWFVEGDVDGDGNADLVIQVDPVAGHAIIASDFLL